MVFRLLFRYLANNEQLVQKLSESYRIRRAAQMAVSIFYRSKMFTDDLRLKELTPERFRSFIQTFKSNVKEEIEGAKQELKKRK